MLELAEALRRREIAAAGLAEHYLARIERIDARVGAYVTIAAESALRQAEEAERRLDEASTDAPPLLGVPVAVKDLTNVANMRCTLGSAACEDFVSPVDDQAQDLTATAG